MLASNDELHVFCKNIRILRIKNGLSQKEMAKLLRIGVRSLRTIETGHIPPRLGCNVFYYAAVHFGLRISALFVPFPGMEQFY